MHFVYKFSVSSLADMTMLSKRRIQVILKELKRPFSDIHLQPKSTLHALCEVQEIKKIVIEAKSCKVGRITIPMLQARLFEVLHKNISASKVRKILTKDLSLTWKKVKNQKFYVSSNKNCALRKIFAEKMIGILK